MLFYSHTAAGHVQFISLPELGAFAQHFRCMICKDRDELLIVAHIWTSSHPTLLFCIYLETLTKNTIVWIFRGHTVFQRGAALQGSAITCKLATPTQTASMLQYGAFDFSPSYFDFLETSRFHKQRYSTHASIENNTAATTSASFIHEISVSSPR